MLFGAGHGGLWAQCPIQGCRVIRIAVLASHGGSILQAVMDACGSGELNAEVAAVISNNSGSMALRRARDASIAFRHLSGRTHPQPSALDAAICAALRQARPDWVLLAGYMKKLGPRTLDAFQGRVLNVHPALLPKHGGRGFHGRRVHQAVVDADDAETGATVHLVDADYDTGPVLAQVRVPVEPGDRAQDVEARVQRAERQLVVDTLAGLIDGRVKVGGGGL